MNMTRLLLVVCTLSTVLSAQSGQVLKGGVVTDHDYRFTLKSMGADRVLAEKQARSLAHGALAGILQRRGCITVLRVEPDLGKNLEQWVALIAESCGIEELDPLSEFDAAVMGIPAKRFIVNQMKGGDSYRTQHLVVVREGFVYRLTTQKRGVGILDPDEDFVRATDCFRLTKGKIKPRTGGKSELVSGAGWEAEGTEFKSAILGIKAIAPESFRLMLGDELLNEAAGASVGITNGRVLMALVGHRATGPKKRAFLPQLQVMMEDQFHSLPGEVRAKLLGKNLVLKKLESKRDPHQKVLSGTIFHGKYCIQALIAFPGHNEAEAIAAAPTLLASVKKLSSGLKRKVLARLKEQQSLNYYVAPRLSVRGWTCRDFKCGFSWAKPSALWTIESGIEANRVLPRARILITNHASSLMARVVGASAPSGTTLESAHEKELAHYPGKRFHSTKVTISGHDALMTRKSVKAEIDLEYRICTVLAMGRQWHIIFSALPGNMPSAKADLKKALAAFTLYPEGLPAREFVAGVYTDHRTGVRFDSGISASKLLQLASPAHAKVGIDSLIKSEGAFCRLMTFCSNGDPGLADEFEAQVRDSTLKDLLGNWPGTPKVSQETLCGFPSVRTDYISDGAGVSFHVLRVGDLSVLVIEKQWPEDPRKPLSERLSLLP